MIHKVKYSELTFIEFLTVMHSSYHLNGIDEIQQIIAESSLINQIPFKTHGVFYIYDLFQNKFRLLSNSIEALTGYESKDFFTNGLEVLSKIIHHDDFKVFNEKIFPKNIQFLQDHPVVDHCKFVFSNNFRMLHKSGNWLHLLNKNLYFTSPDTGLPHFSIGLQIEITDYKQDNLIIHRIDMDALSEHTPNRPLFLTHYAPDIDNIKLSKQERRILHCISEGLNSRQIAEKLHLSDNTIINHRKNMQKKTHTKNVAELISFGFRNKILK